MYYGIRSIIFKEIANSFKGNASLQLTSSFNKSRTDGAPQLHVSWNRTSHANNISNELTKIRFDDKYVTKVSLEKHANIPTLVLDLSKEKFIQEVLNSDYNQLFPLRKEKIVVEFSSPNIAKPFHVGHLRSTIIGNFIANLHKHLKYDVVKLNYLGDWGTQFGLLQIGIEISNLSEDEIRENPIKCLYNAYVLANTEAKSNPEILSRAKMLFQVMETDSTSPILKRWEQLRHYTIEELTVIYNRLGIQFDRYDWESQYSQQQIQDTLKILTRHQLLKDEADGRKIVEVGGRRVPIVKSDNTSLYLARDVAALLDRYNRYSFSKLFYVVDNAQTDHFNAVFTVCGQVNSKLLDCVEHIKFGRIKGMSSRSGNAIFLKDVLDEAREAMLKKQHQSLTTKVNVQNMESDVADTLGISAVLINDFKQRRQRDYEFSWDKALQMNGDSGIKLQYTHCRLSSLIEANESQPDTVANYKLLNEPESLNLIIEISKYSDVLQLAQKTLEPCVIVNYLFSLSNSISRALKCLNVKHEESAALQAQRMLLFVKSRSILYSGMKILGLQPLTKM